jgi:hypothetical protein
MLLTSTGCSSLLPQVNSSSSAFRSFEDARKTIENLVPMQSDLKVLAAVGIDPARYPNTTILTHSDVARRFVQGSVLTKQDLDPGVVVCLEARDACRGLEVVAADIAKVRSGNFFADFMNFSRHITTTGWRFNALILLVNDVVVYRAWGGQPMLNETEVQTNPLGPLQDFGPTVVTNR